MSFLIIILRVCNVGLLLYFFVILSNVYTSKMHMNDSYNTLYRLKQTAATLIKKQNQLRVEKTIYTRLDRLEILAHKMYDLQPVKAEQIVTQSDFPDTASSNYAQLLQDDSLSNLIREVSQ